MEAPIAICLVAIPSAADRDDIPAGSVAGRGQLTREFNPLAVHDAVKAVQDDIDLVAGLLKSLDFKLHAAVRNRSGNDRIARSGIVICLAAERRASLHELKGDVPGGRPPALGQGADPSPGQVGGRQARCERRV